MKTWAQIKEQVRNLVTQAPQRTAAETAVADETEGPRPTQRAWAWAWASALQMASIQSQLIQSNSPPKSSFHALILAILFSFTSILLSKYTNNSKLPGVTPLLEQLGVFFAVTAFYIAITLSLPISLVIFTWILYAFSFLTIILSHSLI